MDADPHGLDILSVFKFGSAGMEHEREGLVAPRLEWLGVYGSEIAASVFFKSVQFKYRLINYVP
jgi:meiotic recombination protein SPO11